MTNTIVSAINVQTGEYGEYIINKTVSNKQFYKIFMADFLLALGILNIKSVDILAYVMEHMRPSDNVLIATQDEIAKGAGTSRRTVMRVFNKLQEIDFMRKKSSGVYMINPKFLMKGNDNKQQLVINYFSDIEPHKKNDAKIKPNDNTDAE